MLTWLVREQGLTWLMQELTWLLQERVVTGLVQEQEQKRSQRLLWVLQRRPWWEGQAEVAQGVLELSASRQQWNPEEPLGQQEELRE